MSDEYPRSVEQVRAELIAQIQHIRQTLTFEFRLSMDKRMEAVKHSMYMEMLVTTAAHEVPGFVAREHAEAYAKFKKIILCKPKRSKKSKD